MEKERVSSFLQKAILTLVLLAIIYIFITLAPAFKPIFAVVKALLLPFLLAALITYLLHPIVEGLHKYGLSRTLSVLIVFLVLIAVIAFAGFLGVPFIIEQVQEALQLLPEQMKEIQSYLAQLGSQLERLPAPLSSHVDEWVEQLQALGVKALDQIEATAISILKSALSLVVIPFLVFYFLKDYGLIQKTVWYLTPKKYRKSLHRYAKDVDHSIGSYIRGQILVSICVFILATIGLWILGVPYAILLGLFIGACDIIPYFGPIIGAAPAIVVALMDSMQTGILAIVVLFIIQQIEGNILSPVIVGRTLHMHPLLIILALLVGVEVGGVIGLLLAVPILAVIKVTLLHLRLYVMKH
ncbi:serine protease [Alkalihalobacillus alcalophilus ATCC 27647 = CGMCC 1.3604]|uniref:Serine protease n=1 Tax=Alkalihalobacillus alcalophilus ATCC 27647 = CGMCC 1.3604 TaxID=1218173 RepID=A0A4S4K2W3_ALKAL|nr:AI-2E family transporter [Alkalihalobacillus alcalophilus]THG90369.1 serine protease [Alkalihalobacillus alcalophilus ATCC 27647 = CGMCC 1.3604]